MHISRAQMHYAEDPECVLEVSKVLEFWSFYQKPQGFLIL